MAKKKKIDELKSFEEKHQTLLAKRDELNDRSRSLREERDALNEKRRELREDLSKLREERRGISETVGKHKSTRDEFQAKAKSMIEMRRRLRSSISKDARRDLGDRKTEASKLEMEQQTIPLTLDEEAALIKRIRALYGQIVQLEQMVVEQKKLKLNFEELDQAIDEAFRLANSEHQKLMILVEERKLLDEKIRELFNEIGVNTAAANAKHDEYMTVRKAADGYHVKARELREKILEIRAERRKEREMERKAVREHNEVVSKQLSDKKRLEEAADGALKELLNQGKVEL